MCDMCVGNNSGRRFVDMNWSNHSYFVLQKTGYASAAKMMKGSANRERMAGSLGIVWYGMLAEKVSAICVAPFDTYRNNSRRPGKK